VDTPPTWTGSPPTPPLTKPVTVAEEPLPPTTVKKAKKKLSKRVYDWGYKFSLMTPSDVLDSYCKVVTRRPCCIILFYIVMLLLLMALRYKPLEVDTNFGSFIIADGAAMRQRDAYLSALGDKKAQDSRRLRAVDANSFEEDLQADAAQATSWIPPTRQRSRRQLGRSTIDYGIDELSLNIDSVTYLPTSVAALNASVARRLAGDTVLTKGFTVLYEARGGNVLDPRVLREVHDIEAKMLATPRWRPLCDSVLPRAKWRCDPGQSYIAYSFAKTSPTAQGESFDIKFDSSGTEPFPEAGTLAYLQQNVYTGTGFRQFFPSAYKAPEVGDSGVEASDVAPAALRSEFYFSILLGDASLPLSAMPAQIAKAQADFAALVEEDVFPLLFGINNDLKYTDAYYYGDVITGYEISRTLRMDSTMAIGSFVFVFSYLWLHTRSLTLSLCSLIMMLGSIPMAFALAPAMKITIASFLSIFVIVGIGSDVIFVYVDFWSQSAAAIQEQLDAKDTSVLAPRLAWTLSHAGRNCLATTLTTAASFFANLASALKPLREFGLFMGLCVVCALAMVVMFLPSLLVMQAPKRESKLVKMAEPEPQEEPQPTGALVAIVPSAPEANKPSASPAPATPNRCPEVLLKFIMNRVESCPLMIVITFALSTVLFGIMVGAMAEMEKGVPDIFPEGHNQVESSRVGGLFASMEKFEVNTPPPIPKGTVCEVAKKDQSPLNADGEKCTLHWCESTAAAEGSVPHEYSGTCSRGRTHHYDATSGASIASEPLDFDFNGCSRVLFAPRVAVGARPTAANWDQEFEAMARRTVPAFTSIAKHRGTKSYGNSVRSLAHLVMEDWESGSSEASLWLQMPAVSAYLQTSAGSTAHTCIAPVRCFFGSGQRCNLDNNYVGMGNINLQDPTAGGRRLQPDEEEDRMGMTPAPRLNPARMLAAKVPQHKQIDITILWGVRASWYTPLFGEHKEPWEYDPSFELNNPWAQRAIRNMVTTIEAAPELFVLSRKCWMDDFVKWMQENARTLARAKVKDLRFPTRDFDLAMQAWYPSTITASDHIWLADGKVTAAKCEFYIDVSKDQGAKALLEHKKRWDEIVERANSVASRTANKAFQTAQAWVRAEAEVAVVSSTIDTILISALCGCLGMLVFTGDPTLAIVVVFLMLGIVISLAFFMVCVMQWKFGPIEVISLVIFVGYAVTFLLHVAHLYNEIPVPEKEKDTHSGEAAVADLSTTASGTILDDSEAEACMACGGVGCGICRKKDYPVKPSDPGPPSEEPPPGVIRDARRYRTREAVLRVGGATLSSAVSTLGCTFFLLFCTMQIFSKLGSVVIAVTCISVTFALVALPACLLLLGPSPGPWHKRWPIVRRFRPLLVALRSRLGKKPSPAQQKLID